MKKNEGAIMKRNKVKYIELPFKVFIERYPDALQMFPPDIRLDLLTDPNYIIRVRDDSQGTTFEVGYSSDDWKLA